MANENDAYPLAAFRYSVAADGVGAGFSEVSGLTLEYDVVRYRDGANKPLGELRLPGRPKVSEVRARAKINAACSDKEERNDSVFSARGWAEKIAKVSTDAV